MSASREKKSRLDQGDATWSDPKTAREAQQRKEEKRSNIMYAVIAVVFVLVAVVAIVQRSGIIQKRAVAATVNGESYTAAEVSYYFQNTYQNFVNQNYYYLSYLGLDTSKSLREQSYGSDEKTWFDYFVEQALNQLADVQALNDAAAADEFTWTDELQAELDASLTSAKAYAASAGHTFDQYLRIMYGSTMTEKVYTAQLKRAILAQAYGQAYEDSLTYPADQLESTYAADRKSYDVVDYQSIRISGAAAATDADGNEIEVTDEMTADAMAAAKTTADELYASFQGGAALESLVPEDEEDNLTYTNAEASTYSSGVVMDWLFDDSRVAGDSAVLADEDSSNYYVVSFGSRYRQEYNIANVRHILVGPAAGELSEGDEGYAEEQAQLKADAKAKAEEILAQWQAGDATAESFAALAQEKSEDSGSAAKGGLIPDISKVSNLVAPFKDWCFVDGRKVGDTGVVESTYGYHIMYLDSFGAPYWEVQVTTSLKNDDFEVWYADKTDGYTAEQNVSGMKYVG